VLSIDFSKGVKKSPSPQISPALHFISVYTPNFFARLRRSRPCEHLFQGFVLKYSFYPSERLSTALFAKSTLVLSEIYFSENSGNFHALLSPINHFFVQHTLYAQRLNAFWCDVKKRERKNCFLSPTQDMTRTRSWAHTRCQVTIASP